MVARQQQGARRHPHELTREEGWALLDAEAQRLPGMSVEELLRRWDAGEITASHVRPEHVRVMNVASLIPFVR